MKKSLISNLPAFAPPSLKLRRTSKASAGRQSPRLRPSFAKATAGRQGFGGSAKSGKCKVEIIGSDVSARALKVARQNAKSLLGKKYNSLNYDTILLPRLRFVKSDLLKIHGRLPMRIQRGYSTAIQAKAIIV